jgi:leucyl aminopeptidase
MSEFVKTAFAPLAAPKGGTCVVFVGPSLKSGPTAHAFLGGAAELIASAAKTAHFEGKPLSALDILAPHGFPAERLLAIGIGGAKEAAETDFATLGGFVFGKLGAAKEVSVAFEAPDGTWGAAAAADFMMGLQLRAYRFDKYKKKKDDDKRGAATVSIGVGDVDGARAAARSREALVAGVEFARDLVNEPPNVLFPVEFANRAAGLAKLGVEIDVLDEKAMAKLGMGSLLGVGQGSVRDSRLVVMRWNGAKGRARKSAPVAFVGKGVCFDTGGISIKPADGMEKMKYDMAGGATMIGAMRAIALLKPKVKVIGIVCATENMPSGKAQKPGDVQIAMSGKSIEIINTDAEGRLVLADGLVYARQLGCTNLVDAATLTGAVVVALGYANAGIFANDDAMYERFHKANEEAGEKMWRLPLDDEYKENIKSSIADIVNSGGRWGGAINAAMFLKEFAEDTPWIHLDIAGTAWMEDQKPWIAKGPSGIALRSLVEFVKGFAN